MGKFIDAIGKKFGKLTVVEFMGFINGDSNWRCECECGESTIVPIGNLNNGHTKSCGCNGGNIKHNMSYSRLYRIWAQMKQRCSNPKKDNYKYYGGKGIKVCDDWNNFELFSQWALSNGYKDNLTIDRIDNNKNYCPNNCRWITNKEQQNNKSTNVRITYRGVEHTIPEWSEIIGIKQSVIRDRERDGWGVEQIMNTPPKLI